MPRDRSKKNIESRLDLSIEEYSEVESGGEEEYSILTRNSDKEKSQEGAGFKTEEEFCKEMVEIRCVNIILLELLEKSEESKGKLKEKMYEHEKILQFQEEECQKR